MNPEDLARSGVLWVESTIRRRFSRHRRNRDDLVSDGMFGLWKAALSWKEGGVMSWRTWAINKIVWEIRDGIRVRARRRREYLMAVLPQHLLYDYHPPVMDSCDFLEWLRRTQCGKDSAVLACLLGWKKYKELAKEIGVNSSRISQRAARLIERLRRILK